MHPEIKKFWEDAGYTIVVDVLDGTYPNDLLRFYWVLVKDERQVGFAGISEDVPQGTKDTPCIIHYIGNNEYSEQEMLRVIRLKAFL